MAQPQYPNAAVPSSSNLAPGSSSRLASPNGKAKQSSRSGTLRSFTNATRNMLHRDRRSRESLSRQNGDTRDDFETSSQASTDLSVNLDDSPRAPKHAGANADVPVHQQPSGTATKPEQIEQKAVAFRSDPSIQSSHELADVQSLTGSSGTYETQATSVHTMPALQVKTTAAELDELEPVLEDDPASYDLLAPADPIVTQGFDLEQRSKDMFGRTHLQTIFGDSTLLLRFTTFLGSQRPKSVPTLIYYLDALKALRAIRYANAVAEALDPLDGYSFTSQAPQPTRNADLEDKASKAFDLLVQEDLPAFITHTFINIVSASLTKRITGTMPPHLREASEGLAEVFCLSDPSRPDNPLVFASEEFHRTTQYGMGYALGRNCRFLQGPASSKASVKRLRDAIQAGRDHCETFVNYRRDGSPFLNLLMMAPLRDSRGTLRYFIGAQVDVTGLAKECSELPALQKMLADRAMRSQQSQPRTTPRRAGTDADGNDSDNDNDTDTEPEDEFQQLSEMFNLAELDLVKHHGGRMHRELAAADDDVPSRPTRRHQPRLLLSDPSPPDNADGARLGALAHHVHGRLLGVYQHYLLVRPYPSLRILFTSPALRVPGILQSHFMNRIGSSERVRDELLAALAEGRGVTAKVRWVPGRKDASLPATEFTPDEGRNRWIHCTPLLGANGNIGVWMIVLVDEADARPARRFRQAPPVPASIPRDTRDRDRVEKGGYGR